MKEKTGTMNWEQAKLLKEGEFLRLTGTKRSVFDRMVLIIKEAEKTVHVQGGRPRKLSVETQLLMALEYLREYRTYFHISKNYGVSESTAYKIIKWIETTLIKHPDFALPGKKALKKSDVIYETILVDVTESPIERPKKNKKHTTPAKRKGTQSKAKSL